MTTTGTFVLLVFCLFVLLGCFAIDAILPTEADENKQAKRDVEEMLKRANQETLTRRRVRG